MITRREALRLAVVAGTSGIVGAQSRLTPSVLHYGRKDPLPEVISLMAGPVSAVFDVETSSLRYVRVEGREIMRAIYAAVRDSDWGTVAPNVHGLTVTTTEQGFELVFDVDCVRPPYDFGWRGRIVGESNGRIRFTFDGQARSTFLRNRLGFALLHPIRECAGNECDVEKVDGSRSKGTFPKLVSPHQPIFDIRAISHAVRPGLTAVVRCEGETFEMEDHRNWTDASYKTYCTPLATPYPVEVPQGTKVSQSITISLQGQLPTPRRRTRLAAPPVPIKVEVGSARPLPRIGLGVAHHGQPLSQREIARLKLLRPSHLRVDCRLAGDDWRESLQRAANQATALGTGLELALHLPADSTAAVADFARQLSTVKARIAGALLYRAEGKAADEAWLAGIRKSLGGVRVAVGTDDGFVMLNRNRPAGGAFDAVCYAINPQVHAIDNMTMAENLEAQADTVETARQIAPGKGIWVSPVTLKLRYNPNAKNPASPTPAGQLPANVDPRQLSLFGAGWTAGSVKFLAQSGADSVTYFETTGWRGVMETEAGSSLPDLFPSTAGSVFPLYHVLADVAEFAGGQVLRCESGEPLAVDALVLRSGRGTRILVFNLTHEPRSVRIEGLALTAARARRLNESNAESAMARPEEYRRSAGGPLSLDLGPYELVSI